MQMEMKRKSGMTIFISDKIYSKTKPITRGKEGHYIILKGSIQREDITFANLHAPTIGASKYIKKILVDIKGETDSNTDRRGF